MSDKLKFMESPKEWRIRNKMEIPEEYLEVMRKHANETNAIAGCLFFLVFIIGFLCGLRM